MNLSGMDWAASRGCGPCRRGICELTVTAMKILVTGANGLLGRELCRQLGDQAVPTDIDILDLTDPVSVAGHLCELEPDVIVHTAAYTAVDRAEDEPEACRAVNVGAVENLVAPARQLGCPLLLVSTDYVFCAGSHPGVPYTEAEPPAPRGVYAQSKADAERIAASGARHWIVRTCGLYARPDDTRARHFVGTMLRLAGEGQPLRVVDDQVCSPTYAPDLARAIVFLIGAGGNPPAPAGTYHVTSTGGTSWYRFAAELFRQAGIQADLQPIASSAYSAKAPRPPYSVLDTSRYHHLGGPPMPTWQSALSAFLACRPRTPS